MLRGQVAWVVGALLRGWYVGMVPPQQKNWKMPMRGNGVAVEPDKKHNNQPQNKKALQRTVIERSTRRVTMAGER